MPLRPTTIPPLLAVLAVLAALLLSGLPDARAQAVALTADATSIPYHTLVHLTATAPAGTVTFADNGTPLLTVPVTAGKAVLGIATLGAGAHTLTAVAGPATSNAVSVDVTTGLPSAFKLLTDATTVFDHNTLTFTLDHLLPRATGSVTYAHNGVAFATDPISPAVPTPAYQAFGDSIASGYSLANFTQAYPYLFAAANGFPRLSNFAANGSIACDVLPLAILPHQAGPTQDASPLYTLMIGSNDMLNQGVPLGEPNFTACHRAVLAWLGIPREYKVLPGDPALTVLSGVWALPPAQYDATAATLYNSSGSGAAQFALTSNGGPLYLWYLLGDHLTGAFTVSLDGTPTGTTYTTNPASPIASRNNPASTGFALLRLPVSAGPHTLRVDVASGTVGLLAAATPPSPGGASVHPTVFSTDVPNQNLSQAFVTPAVVDQYSADALADVTLLAADGLDLRPVSTHTYLTGNPAEFNDFVHPSQLGQQHLAAAFQAAFGSTPLAPFDTWLPTIQTRSLLMDGIGAQDFTATYSGDSLYAPSSASASVLVVPDSQSTTHLTAAATTFYASSPITATATIFPGNPGSTVSLMEGAQVLATARVTVYTAVLTAPPLRAGLHTLYAAYGGDASNAASVSPPLQIQVLQNPTTLALSAPNSLAYAATGTLVATLNPASATGSLEFTDSFTPRGQTVPQAAQSLGQVALSAGAASFPLPTLLPGMHAFSAVYHGDQNDAPSGSSTVITNVESVSSVTTLAAVTAPYGQPSTFIATLSAGSVLAFTGTVTFTDSLSATTLQIPVKNGAATSTATWTATTLASGNHTITAAYSGDAIHAASTSAALATAIPRAPSTLTLSGSAASLYTGSPVTFTAALSPAAGTGTLLFTDATGQATLGQATLAAGIATLTLPGLAPGSYSISATYSGDANTLPALSAATPLQVISKATTTTLTAPSTAVYAASVTLSAAVTNAPSGALVRFFDGASLLGGIALTSAGNAATFSTSTLATGTHTLTATFLGDATHEPSTGSAAVTITPAASATTVTLAQVTLLAGSPAVVTIRVATGQSMPGGSVTLRSGSIAVATAPLANGSAGVAYATVSLATGTTGTFPLTAFYSGDPNTQPSDSSALALAYTVAPRVATGTLTLSSSQVPPETPVTLSASFTSPGTTGPALIPSGTVAFLNGTSVVATVALDSAGQATYLLPPTALGNYTLTAVYLPSGVFAASPVPARTLTVTPPLAVAFTTPAITMEAASTIPATTTASVTTLSGYQGAVATQCATSETYLTCTVDALPTLTGPAIAQVHLALSRNHAALTPATQPGCLLGEAAALALLFPLLFTRRRRRLTGLLLLALAATLTTALTGCAEGGNFGQIPTGTYLVKLTATAANTPATATLNVNIH